MLPPISQKVIAAAAVTESLALTSVLLRFSIRWHREEKLKADDWTILGAFTTGIMFVVDSIYAGATNLYSLPIPEMSEDQYAARQKITYAGVFMTTITLGLIKLSILFFYRRIFETRTFRRITLVLMVIVGLWIVGGAIAHVASAPMPQFAQLPIYKLKDQYEIYLMSIAVIDIALDVTILALPGLVIKDLQMSTRKKIALVMVFGLGFFCIVCSAIRTYWVWQLQLWAEGKIGIDKYSNVSIWSNVWTMIEGNISVVTACLPPLAPLVGGVRHIESMFLSIGSLASRSISSLKSNRGREQDLESDDAQKLTVHPEGLKRPWYNLNTIGEQHANASHVPRSTDEESVLQHPTGIKVKQVFGSDGSSYD
ncbi:MAG: hypothetical protein M1821_000736 [Bathelium mastoideum]|nr:MAG: hypothetical protein M1821_000736 [Bathelium mastoideum]